MLSPSAMERAEFSTALWITLFPAVFAVMLKASIMGTPDETRVPKVRVNLDMAVFLKRPPIIGNLSQTLSIRSFPLTVRPLRTLNKMSGINYGDTDFRDPERVALRKQKKGHPPAADRALHSTKKTDRNVCSTIFYNRGRFQTCPYA